MSSMLLNQTFRFSPLKGRRKFKVGDFDRVSMCTHANDKGSRNILGMFQ